MLAGASPEVLVAAIAGATARHAGRQRRRDAAPLQPAEGRRDVLDPRRAAPGADRSRPRPRRRDRPADHVRASARPPPGLARTISPSSSPSCSATSTARSAVDHPFARLQASARRRRATGDRGCSARRCRARSGRPTSASPTRSPTSSTPTAPGSARGCTASARLRAQRPSQTAVAVWALAADTDDEAQRLASSSRMTLRELRRGRLIAVPPPETALAYLERERRRRARAARGGR